MAGCKLKKFLRNYFGNFLSEVSGNDNVLESNKNNNKMLQNLPTEITWRIFSYLKKEDLLSVGLVCKEMTELANDSQLWKQIAIEWFPFFNFENSIKINSEHDIPELTNGEFYLRLRNSRQDISTDWKQTLKEVVTGNRASIIQIIDRHLQQGVFLSAYDAIIFFQQNNEIAQPHWVVKHFRGMRGISELTKDEFIPHTPENFYRFRKIPNSLPISYSQYDLYFDSLNINDYQPGTKVEIQFRFNPGDPFGWWYGVVSSFDDETSRVKVEFDQFAVGSPWRFETILIGKVGTGNSNPDRNQTGGLRFCTDQDMHHWNIRKIERNK